MFHWLIRLARHKCGAGMKMYKARSGSASYNQKMLSMGNILDLYVYGYDFPEACATEKDRNIYYAFYAQEKSGDARMRRLKRFRRAVWNCVDWSRERAIRSWIT